MAIGLSEYVFADDLMVYAPSKKGLKKTLLIYEEEKLKNKQKSKTIQTEKDGTSWCIQVPGGKNSRLYRD